MSRSFSGAPSAPSPSGVFSPRGLVGRIVHFLPPRSWGRLVQIEARPSVLGRRLWSAYHAQCSGDLDSWLARWLETDSSSGKALVDDDFMDDEAAAALGCAWAYGFFSSASSSKDAASLKVASVEHGLMILAAYRARFPEHSRPPSDPQAVWFPVAVLALDEGEPDWLALDAAPPLDPCFEANCFKRVGG